MKRFLTILLSVLTLASIDAGAQAQVQIQTKKNKISDLTTKTTKVVLCGGDILNMALTEEVSRRWMVSPFEFCTFDEYQKIKGSDSYYFLVPQNAQQRKESEPGLTVLSLVKGGEGDGLEVVSVPLCSADDSDGREMIYLPAILNIIQNFAYDATVSDKVTIKGIKGYARGLNKSNDKTLIIAREDLAQATAEDRFDANIKFMSQDAADELFTEGAPDTIIGYVVAPTDPQKGSVCYLYLIGADSHQLYYCDKYKIAEGARAGFRQRDLKTFAAVHKNK